MSALLNYPEFHMYFMLLLTVLAAISFVREKVPIEVTSVGLLTALLLFGQMFPVLDANGRNQLDAAALLTGFANPALVAVLALLVMGQAMTQTNALRPVTRLFMTSNKKWAWISIFGIFALVLVLSAFMNNTPLVILTIPILQVLSESALIPQSRIMIPLSYAAILGGMTTLVGSSTNMLVSGSMIELGYEPLQFFDFVVPGAMLAAIGFVYVIVILPRFLPDRASLASQLVGDEKEFIAELDITPDSKLTGMECVDGVFPKLPDLKIRLIQRSGHLILPPFEGYIIEPADILIVAATRDTLADLLSQYPGYLLSEEEEKVMTAASKRQEEIVEDPESEKKTSEEETKEEPPPESMPSLDEKVEETRVLAEIMITPASRMIEMTLEQVGIHRQFGAIVLGIQRRARAVRRRLGRIRLEAGDVLLVAGSHGSIDAMRGNQDLIVLSGSRKELPIPAKAPLAAGIMLAVVGCAAFGILSIPVAAISGAVILISTDCLNIRQAVRAIDRKIFLLVGSMLALGTGLQATGGAKFVAEQMLELPFADVPLAMVAVLFLVVAFCTNVLSNNACAILFTPVALNMAVDMGIDPFIFASTVIFAANCSFASPIGYKTNLLVVGPGHYRFRDFLKAGVPLVLLLWVSYIFIAKYYFGL